MIVIRHPSNNLIPSRMVLFTAVWIGFLYGISILLRSEPVTDYGSVYQTAWKLASGEAVEDWSYFSMWTPVWACTNSFYSDQLSFGGSMIAIAILLRCKDMSGYKKYFLYLLSGILWGLAIVAKATAGIPLAAFIITVILTAKNQKKIYWKSLSLVLVIALCIVGMSLISDIYPSRQEEQRLKFSTEYWVALGLLKNGTYGENPEFIEGCYLSPDQDARKEYC